MANLDNFIAELESRGHRPTPEIQRFNEHLKDVEAWKSRPLLCRLGLHAWDRIGGILPRFKCRVCRKETN